MGPTIEYPLAYFDNPRPVAVPDPVGPDHGNDRRGRLRSRAAWNTRLVHAETPQYEPDEDPDTGPATTPEEVEDDADRDQAEGGDQPEEGGG
jgi:hypothetical protein